MAPKTDRNAPTHPSYAEMVTVALKALKERNGSSVAALRKFFGANYMLPQGWEKVLSVQLKKLVASGKLVKVKASYKLGEALKNLPAKKEVEMKASKKSEDVEKSKPNKKTNVTDKPEKKTEKPKPKSTKPAVAEQKVAVKKTTVTKTAAKDTKKAKPATGGKSAKPAAKKRTASKRKAA